MTIKKDNRGNYFEGSTLNGAPWSPDKLLALLHASLGSTGRAFLSKESNAVWRIDWRTNEDTTEENITGAIDTSVGNIIRQFYSPSVPQQLLAENARFAFSLNTSSSGNISQDKYSPYLMANNSVQNFANAWEKLSNGFSSSAIFWAVARDSNFAFFIQSGSNTFFISQGLLLDARLAFPGSQYSIASKGGTRTLGAVQNGGNYIDISTSGDIANFAHVRKSDDTSMESEVELYFRQTSNGDYLGYAANLWKLHIDEGETAPNVGDIVVLDLSLATGYYKGEGEVPCIVAARLGNTSAIDLTGDYILMRIAQ